MEDPFGGLRRNPRYLIARCYLFNIPLFFILHSVFGIVIMYFLRTLMYEMDLCCNSFSLLDPWEKCGSFGFSLGVCPTDTARCSCFRGA